MKTWKKLAVFSALVLLIIYAFNFSAYDFSGKRDLYAQIAIDKDYTNQNPHWSFIVPTMLENVSEFYWQEFKIRLIMPPPSNYTRFKSPNKLATIQELNFLSKSVPESDIIIGFTGRKLPEPNKKPVYADADSFIVLIANQYPPSGQIQLLKHEIAHLFAIGHQSDTIMDETPKNFVMSNDPVMQNFSNFHKTIIKITKYSNFKLRKFYYRLYH